MSSTRLGERWEKLPRSRKGYVFLGLGVVAVVGLILGVSLTDIELQADSQTPADSEEGTIFDACSFYSTLSTNPIELPFTYEGVSCRTCDVGLDSKILLSGCNNPCTSWIVDPFIAELDAVSSSCDPGITPTPPPPPGADFECPEGFYVTNKETGCIADSIEDFILLGQSTFLLGERGVTLEDCFQVCEVEDCIGVVVAADGDGCFGLKPDAKELCSFEVEGSTICKKIEHNFVCFDDRLTYFEAEAACESTGDTLVFRELPDPFDIQLARIAEACTSDRGCFFDNNGAECIFVDTDGSIEFDIGCASKKGHCCEVPTESPTVSPTASPTFELFFVPECNGTLQELSFQEARDCCFDNGGDLAAIHSQAEQDFAYSKCEAALEAEANDCGCWIGFIRDVASDPLDPKSFFWTDSSDVDFLFFEDYPEPQPNNQGDRDELCVHMRPFTDGGWNDLPCSGFCDARDTKPFPLCRRFTEAPTTSPTVSPTLNPTAAPTRLPTVSPTESPTAAPTRLPTFSPTKMPTVSPTANPTVSPTPSPTISPTPNPTVSPTKNPTVSPTKKPTTSPTVSPTVTPTEHPTISPTVSPTTTPTRHPTVSPTKNPTVSPTRSPTFSPTRSPTESPTESPTRNPTISPTKSPTTSPTVSPTRTPTLSPTILPTPNPTFSPTFSPFDPGRPGVVCKFDDGEFVWRFTNKNLGFTIPFFFFFENPNGRAFFPGKPGSYPPCTFFVCSSFDFQVGPGETIEFSTPTTEIVAVFPCDPVDPNPCFLDIIEPEDVIDCVCNLTTFFEDDFEIYPVTNGLQPDQSPEFFDKWEVFNGTVDIKGFLEDEDGNLILDGNGDPIPSSRFFVNPCLETGGTKCVDIDGTVSFEPETNTQATREIDLPPSDAFFNRICTMNFFARGNGRCGTKHVTDIGINNPGQAKAAGCIAFYRNNPVPLFDDLTVGITEEGELLKEVVFEDIVWNQTFEPYGITTDVNNNATLISGFFEVVAGKLSPEEGGGNIGPLLDNVDVTCCCPIPEDKYIGRVLDKFQGPTFDGSPVPKHKSDYRVVINKPAGYELEYKTVYALGLGGTITLEFSLGATEYIYIYEESYVCCREYDPEDAFVEASVDGVNWILVKESFKDDWIVLDGGDYSIRKSRVELPNGACFKYIRITDTSDPDCHAADGFDLISVEVKKPCCPTPGEPLSTPAPTTATTDVISFSEVTVATTGSLLGFTIMGVAAGLLAGLTALTVSSQRRQRRMSESSILEPKDAVAADHEEVQVKEVQKVENEAVATKAL